MTNTYQDALLLIVGFSISRSTEGVGVIELRALSERPTADQSEEEMMKKLQTHQFGITPRACRELAIGLGKLAERLNDPKRHDLN